MHRVLADSDKDCGGADSWFSKGARRWLTRHAAAAKVLTAKVNGLSQTTLDCFDFLLLLLPGLEAVIVTFYDGALADESDDDNTVGVWSESLDHTLYALAQCIRLQALQLHYPVHDEGILPSFPIASLACAFAKLTTLVRLDVSLSEYEDPTSVGPGMLGVVASLTGLTELRLHVYHEPGTPQERSFVPASLSALRQLRRLELGHLHGLRLEAGCLDLPDLASLTFDHCRFADTPVQLPGMYILSRLTSLAFLSCDGLRSLCDYGLKWLPRLQSLVCVSGKWDRHGVAGGVGSNLPAGMGTLRPTLLRLDLSGVNLRSFPLAVTQLTALQCLQASENSFAVVPDEITALGRLETLELGRRGKPVDNLLRGAPVNDIDASALGDLSPFPLLCTLSFARCKVMLSGTFVAAAGHGRLANLLFGNAHPAPECMPEVLQLWRDLQRQGRGGVLQLKECDMPARLCNRETGAPWTPQDITPCMKFRHALEACGF